VRKQKKLEGTSSPWKCGISFWSGGKKNETFGRGPLTGKKKWDADWLRKAEQNDSKKEKVGKAGFLVPPGHKILGLFRNRNEMGEKKNGPNVNLTHLLFETV